MTSPEVKNVIGCRGRYTISTDKRGVLAEFDNLITNNGMNRLGETGDVFNFCFVGTGNTPPAFTDTALANKIATNSASISGNPTATTVFPYTSTSTFNYPFALGEVVGNISEVGTGWRISESNYGLASRALILDQNGLPTTITVLADEILQVQYKFEQIINADDVTGTVVFTGNKGGTFDWTSRPGHVGDTYYWGYVFGYRTAHSNNASVFSTALGTIFEHPANASGNLTSAYIRPYVTDSYTSIIDVVLAPGTGAYNLRSVVTRFGNTFYQTEFTPPIPKTAADQVVITFSLSWARA